MTPAQMELLVTDFEMFLRVPKVTYTEWVALDDDTKAALVVASRHREVDGVLLLAKALRSPLDALELTKDLDGGDTWITAHLSAFMDELAEEERPLTFGK